MSTDGERYKLADRFIIYGRFLITQLNQIFVNPGHFGFTSFSGNNTFDQHFEDDLVD
jgi:hypothetical protein